MADPVKQGVLLIDKPRGLTSFGVVSRLRRLIGEKKIGHTGTLDPFAEGLLAVCIGKATAAVQFMDTYAKTYQVRVLFGQATDTMDLTGTVTEQHVFAPGELKKLKSDDFASVRQAIAKLPGEHLQVPPMYSAVKVDGQPLYTLARAGQTVDRKARPIVIHQATLDAIDCQTGSEDECQSLGIELTLDVSKGTYIRVIADELGRQLGYFAHAQRLVRTRVGPFSLTLAMHLADLEERFDTLADQIRANETDLDDKLIRRQVQNKLWQELVTAGQVHSLTDALSGFPRLMLQAQTIRKLVQGQKICLPLDVLQAGMEAGKEPQAGPRLAIHGPDGLAGICHLETVPDDDSRQNFRIITERIFIHHERLLSD